MNLRQHGRWLCRQQPCTGRSPGSMAPFGACTERFRVRASADWTACWSCGQTSYGDEADRSEVQGWTSALTTRRRASAHRSWRHRRRTSREHTATWRRPWRWPKSHRYLATIVEQGPGIAALLRSLPAGTYLKAHVDELSVRAKAVAASSRGSRGLLPGGLLSERELTVLGLLSSRLTTTEIAGALFASPNTLKSHIKGI